MTAKEMFEELGYEQEIKFGVIYYYKRIYIPKRDIVYMINFIPNEREVFISKNIDIKELKAINQQCKELGWEVVDENK